MRHFSIAACSLVAVLMAACSQSGSSPTPQSPSSYESNAGRSVQPLVPQRLIVRTNFHGRLAPASARRGIYVSEFFLMQNNVIGFRHSGKGPICNVSTNSNVGQISADRSGHLIVPGGSAGINVYKGPKMCGPVLGTITYTGAGSAAAIDAVNGPILIGEAYGVAVCYLADNECTPLKSPNMGSPAGVAMDGAGNCYADAFDSSGSTGLWVYRRCKRAGKELTSANGFSEPYYGGLSVDNRGHLTVVSLFNASLSTPSTVTVYSGCITGTCKTVGGPFNLQGESILGGLDLKNEHWVTADLSDGMIEIYAYGGGGTSLNYRYSFDNGLSCITNACESATYSPASPQK